MKPSRLVLASATVVVLVLTATMAEAKPVAYYGVGAAYLIDWQGKGRTRVVNNVGGEMGWSTDQGTYKLITLDQPLSVLDFSGDDSCGHYEVRQLTKQVVVRDLPEHQGQIVEMVELAQVGGCLNGWTWPFGSPDDPGVSTRRMAMSARPPMQDLLPGLQLAGPSDSVWPADSSRPSQDVVSVQVGSVVFRGSGRLSSSSFSVDGWWVMSLDGGAQRAQTRMEVDAKTGGESWLVAEWADGLAQRVGSVRFVKLQPDPSGFGTLREAARKWLSGAAVGTNMQFVHALFRDGTGDRIQTNFDTGLEFHRPIQAWGLDGADLWEQMFLTDDGSVSLNRRWAPLRNVGKNHWVMESFEEVFDGVSTPLPARVTYYIDTGKAVKPAAQ